MAMAVAVAFFPGGVRWSDVLILLGFTASLAVGLYWTQRVWRDLKDPAEEPSTDPSELLEPLSGAFAAGQMTDEEFARVRESVRRAASPDGGAPPSHSEQDPTPPPDPGLPTPPGPG
jgi:hypothetical protein